MHYGIIAAGNGSRLRQECAEYPKPLIRIQGEPMIGRLIGIFMANSAESISIIVNEEMKEVQAYVRELQRRHPDLIRLVVKSTPSSLHSFAELCSLIPKGGRFVITTVDTIFRADDFRRYTEAFEKAGDLDGMMAVTSYIDDEKPLYVATAGDGDGEKATSDPMRITCFLDEPGAGTRFISGGIYGLGPKAFATVQRCMAGNVSRMRNFQRALVADGLRLRAFDMGKILDIDHVGDIAKAEAYLSGK